MSKTAKALILYEQKRKLKTFWLTWQELRREIAQVEKELRYSLISLNRLRQKIPA